MLVVCSHSLLFFTWAYNNNFIWNNKERAHTIYSIRGILVRNKEIGTRRKQKPPMAISTRMLLWRRSSRSTRRRDGGVGERWICCCCSPAGSIITLTLVLIAAVSWLVAPSTSSSSSCWCVVIVAEAAPMTTMARRSTPHHCQDEVTYHFQQDPSKTCLDWVARSRSSQQLAARCRKRDTVTGQTFQQQCGMVCRYEQQRTCTNQRTKKVQIHLPGTPTAGVACDNAVSAPTDSSELRDRGVSRRLYYG